jgi:hypothetical protein
MKTREVIGSRRCRLASEGGKASANKQAEHHELEGTKAIAQPDTPPRGKCVNKADDWDCELLSGHVVFVGGIDSLVMAAMAIPWFSQLPSWDSLVAAWSK